MTGPSQLSQETRPSPSRVRQRPRSHAVGVLAVIVAGLLLVTACGQSSNRGAANTTAPPAGGTQAPAAVKAPGTTAPARMQWDAVVMGAPPAFIASPRPLDAPVAGRAAPGGLYLWNDFAGWHVRVVRNPTSPAVEVTVKANDQPNSSVKVERIINVTAPPPAAAPSVTVTMPAGTSTTGFDMSTGFYTNSLSFLVKSGADVLAPTLIYLGAAPSTSTKNPVLLTRSTTPH